VNALAARRTGACRATETCGRSETVASLLRCGRHHAREHFVRLGHRHTLGPRHALEQHVERAQRVDADDGPRRARGSREEGRARALHCGAARYGSRRTMMRSASSPIPRLFATSRAVLASSSPSSWRSRRHPAPRRPTPQLRRPECHHPRRGHRRPTRSQSP